MSKCLSISHNIKIIFSHRSFSTSCCNSNEYIDCKYNNIKLTFYFQQSTGFYDPNNAYGGNSLPTGTRNDGPGALNSLGNANVVSTATGTQGSNSNTDKGGFGSSGVATSDSNSSPIPSSGMQTTQQSQQQAAQQVSYFIAN